MTRACRWAALGCLALFLCSSLVAEDWPTYMHDNARSGITAEELTVPLSLHWQITPPAPRSSYTAQGYWLLTEDFLITPSGRSTPYFFSATTGELAYRLGYRGKNQGGPGTYATIANGELISGTQLKLSYYDMTTGRPGRTVGPALKICATPETMYILTPDSVRALKPAYFTVLAETNKMPRTTSGMRNKWRQRLTEIVDESSTWILAGTGLESMIMAGTALFVGGKNTIMAIDRSTGKALWQEDVAGTVKSLTVANDNLLASTAAGKVLCFRSGDPTATESIPAPRAKATDEDVLRTATQILADTGTVRGYCLLLGERSSSLAVGLAAQSDLRVTCTIEDAAKADEKRQELIQAGLYGWRVVVDSGAVEKQRFPHYFANLVIADSSFNAADWAHTLKPNGGTLVTWAPGKQPELIRERGNVPVGADWTHQYADPGNSGTSVDKALSVPLSLLWYGEPGIDTQPERHQMSPAPLVSQGRVYLQCESVVSRSQSLNTTYLMCFDAYNGVEYWRTVLPNARRMVALNWEDGTTLWDKKTNHNLRPLVIGDTVIAVPFSFDLKTGKQRMKTQTKRGKASVVPWKCTMGGCGILTGSPVALFGRMGSSGYLEPFSDEAQVTVLPGARPGVLGQHDSGKWCGRPDRSKHGLRVYSPRAMHHGLFPKSSHAGANLI